MSPGELEITLSTSDVAVCCSNLSNVASRLCDEAKPGQILISPRVLMKDLALDFVELCRPLELVGYSVMSGVTVTTKPTLRAPRAAASSFASRRMGPSAPGGGTVTAARCVASPARSREVVSRRPLKSDCLSTAARARASATRLSAARASRARSTTSHLRSCASTAVSFAVDCEAAYAALRAFATRSLGDHVPLRYRPRQAYAWLRRPAYPQTHAGRGASHFHFFGFPPPEHALY
jgi:hypothetical protein